MVKKRLRKAFRENPSAIFALLTLYLLAVSVILTTIDGIMANEVASYAYYFLVLALVCPPLLRAIGRRNHERTFQIKGYNTIKRLMHNTGSILLEENLGIFICSWTVSTVVLLRLSHFGESGFIVAMLSGLVIASSALALFERIPEVKN